MSLTGDDKNWMLAQLERVETNLLTQFHKWASRAEALSERVTKLEDTDRAAH